MRSDSFWVSGCDWRYEEPSTGWEVHCRKCCSVVSFGHDLLGTLLLVPEECQHCGAKLGKPRNPWVHRRHGMVLEYGWDPPGKTR